MSGKRRLLQLELVLTRDVIVESVTQFGRFYRTLPTRV